MVERKSRRYVVVTVGRQTTKEKIPSFNPQVSLGPTYYVLYTFVLVGS